MGCDICVRIETKIDGTWMNVPWINTTRRDGDPPNPFEVPSCFDERNYTLFGILAAVRSHTVRPIADPRGIPPDSPAVGADRPSGGMVLGEHSFSSVTLAELLEYPWENPDATQARAWAAAMLPVLSQLGPPTAVRLVFGFDS